MTNIFDQMSANNQKEETLEFDSTPTTAVPDSSASELDSAQHTPVTIKAALHELLKYGLLEAQRKPNLYHTACHQTQALNDRLEALDFTLGIDDIRGLAFLKVAPSVCSKLDSEDNNSEVFDEWSHPLLRRQRLNLEQSLLVALLRQHYVLHEQEAGIGAGDAHLSLDELLPQLQLFLGDPGSEIKEQKRLRNLLESLKQYSLVSEVNAREEFTIRPIITHLANPSSLQSLLASFQAQVNTQAKSDPSP